MSKLDITTLMATADRMLLEVTDPLHRQMLENYRRHALSEVAGRWENIFEAGMLIEEPHYTLSFKGTGVDIKGRPALKQFYMTIGQPVILLQDEEIFLSGSTFTSVSISNHFVRGDVLATLGAKVNDPQGYYMRRKMGLTFWRFDYRGRLIGENGGEAGPIENVKISEAEYITPEEAREKLTPLIRPLPAFGATALR